jgi:quercetin dioxygenase-like cupin family protein
MRILKYLSGANFLVAGACLLGLVLLVGAGDQSAEGPRPVAITLDPAATDYVRLLQGPPQTVTMRSGLVVLEPGTSVGTHNTDDYEEVLLVVEGAGKMLITDGPELMLTVNTMAYCPPRTEHNVTNTGKAPLRYVYIVASAKP